MVVMNALKVLSAVANRFELSMQQSIVPRFLPHVDAKVTASLHFSSPLTVLSFLNRCRAKQFAAVQTVSMAFFLVVHTAHKTTRDDEVKFRCLCKNSILPRA